MIAHSRFSAVAATALGLVATAGANNPYCPTSYCSLQNGFLRFGNGYVNSVNGYGLLEQPFAYSQYKGAWQKLSENTNTFEAAIGTTDDNDYWHDSDVSTLYSLYYDDADIDYSGFIVTKSDGPYSIGYGTITATFDLYYNGDNIRVTFDYYLGQNSPALSVTSTIENRENYGIDNVYLWYGITDDYIGTSGDRPSKTRGNWQNGQFVANTDFYSQAKALKIYDEHLSIFISSSESNANTAYDWDGDFYDVVNQNPYFLAPQSWYSDNSYAVVLPFGDLYDYESKTRSFEFRVAETFDRCYAVTLFDTFGDGWGSDVALQVKTLRKTENLQLTCPYDLDEVTHVVCSCDPYIEFSIVDLVDRPRETWEVLWKVEPLGKYSQYGASYFGDYHTVITGTIQDELNAEDPVYIWYEDDAEEEDEEYAECKPCPKPKPKPKPKPEEDVVYEYSYSNSYDYDSCPFYYSSEVSSYSVDQAAKPAPKPKPLRKLQIQLHYSQEYSHSSFEFSSYEYSSYSSYEWSNSFFCRYSSYEWSSYSSYDASSNVDYCSTAYSNSYLDAEVIFGKSDGYNLGYDVVGLGGANFGTSKVIPYEDRWFQSEMDLIPVPMYFDSGVYSYNANYNSPFALFQPLQFVPATLATPHYTIATEDRVHLIKEGTMCKIDGTEVCEEYLPDGNYVFRVTGALRFWEILDDDEKKWTFCGMHGTWMEELEFTIEEGNCYPGRKVEAFDVCNTAPACSLSGNMVLRGISDELNAYDTALLENDLAAMLSEVSGYPSKAMIETWQSTSNGLYITYKLVVEPKVQGDDALASDLLDGIASDFDTKAANFASNGKFVSLLAAGLNDLPLNTEISVNKATSVVFAHVVPNQCTFRASKNVPLSATSKLSEGLSASYYTNSLASFESTLLVVVGAAGLIATAFFVVTRFSRVSAEEAEEETQESQRRPFAADVSRRGVDIELVAETAPQF